jgi:hypothetical protein
MDFRELLPLIALREVKRAQAVEAIQARNTALARVYLDDLEYYEKALRSAPKYSEIIEGVRIHNVRSGDESMFNPIANILRSNGFWLETGSCIIKCDKQDLKDLKTLLEKIGVECDPDY